eukprot:TRINITY_DN3949_c0_g1_i1.p1 TRINITY_DN3949_c0_g1~~TRINITY_DN3949_c0_g1_i1.p1  ORF type:complete len:472 (-),score=120.02 TRINITY_DN3949_c0_g1_i1:116-1531(-)
MGLRELLFSTRSALALLGPLFVWATYKFRHNSVVDAILREVTDEVLVKEHDRPLIMMVMFLLCCITVVFIFALYVVSRKAKVYLLDFAVFHPPETNSCNKERFMELMAKTGYFTPEGLDFQRKMVDRAGIGDQTYVPDGLLNTSFEFNGTRDEALGQIAGSCDELFRKTGISPREIDFVIVNCSLFNPTPSLSAMIINKYKMRKDVKNYNLSGMGCSAGLVSIDLARDLLQLHPGKNCLVVSFESTTEQIYKGVQKSMLLSNCLFRVGAAAMLLTNKRSLISRAKYELVTTVRVHYGSDDTAYRAIYQEQDDKGYKGVRLSRDLVKVVGLALKSNFTILGPQVLPYSEQFKYIYDYLMRRFSKSYKAAHPHQYMPNFRKAFEHFCIHAGGRGIIDGLEDNLHLTPEDVLPSRATLYRYGNTSSSSVWYELNYIERKGLMKRGDKTWQIAFGSGLKCNSVVWRARKTMRPPQ